MSDIVSQIAKQTRDMLPPVEVAPLEYLDDYFLGVIYEGTEVMRKIVTDDQVANKDRVAAFNAQTKAGLYVSKKRSEQIARQNAEREMEYDDELKLGNKE